MSKDAKDELRALNEEIGRREDEKALHWFNARLAPHFAMRRADGTFHGREAFLDALKRDDKPERRTTTVNSVELLGDSRAVVACVVERGGRQFHNLRLFVREGDTWLLLAWANAPL